jgi:hypothetical protein
VLGAIPLLHQAERVSIFSAPQCESEGAGPAELAESLQWHGIRAHRSPALGMRALREQRWYGLRSSNKRQ